MTLSKKWVDRSPRSDQAHPMRTPFTLRFVLGFAVLALVSGCQGSMPNEASSGQPVSTNLDDPGVKTADAHQHH